MQQVTKTNVNRRICFRYMQFTLGQGCIFADTAETAYLFLGTEG